jgi:cytochrome c
MRRLLPFATALALWLPSGTWAADGKALFDANGCGACHKGNADGVGPSLAKIAGSYAGDKAALAAFLAGKGKPRVDPGKLIVMQPNLKRTEALTDDERGAMADFILGHK